MRRTRLVAIVVATALAASGCSLWTWGHNGFGQLGDGTTVAATSPSELAGDWVDVATGTAHTCRIAGDRSLWCGGDNGWSQLGTGAPVDVDVTGVIQVGTDTDWRSIEAGAVHTCGIKTDGSVWCWGDNSDPFAQGTALPPADPVRAGTDTDWRSVTPGDAHTCGLKLDGSLWCWGMGTYGQLGLGDEQRREEPTRMGTATWRDVSAGGIHTCGIRTDRTLWCWGTTIEEDAQGGTRYATHRVPTPIGTDADWELVDAGFDVTCGVRTDRSLWCWGSNLRGEVGDGTTIARGVPVAVGAATDWVTVSTNDLHTCGIRAGGTLWCWGDNSSGQLGDGTTTDRPAPVQVGVGTRWWAVSTGGSHTAALAD